MHWTKFKHAAIAAACAAAALLAACGGGGDAAGPRVPIARVVVAGDSLADVGAFGVKATVQDASNPAGFPLFPQIVAQDYGIGGQCNHYIATGADTFAPSGNAACTNFAVDGGRVVSATGGAQAVPNQLVDAATALGPWSPTDLILVVGGGNDAADLITAYLGAASDSAGLTAYQNFLARQLDPATIAATLAQPNGAAAAAGLYLQKTADTYYNAVQANALDKGATHVAVLNMPDVTLTPRFRAVLAAVAQANGAAAAAALQGAIRQWIGAFNGQLEARVGGDTRVALVNFNADFTDEVSRPAIYGLTNVTQAACPPTGVDASGLPTYTFATCTSAALDAAPPAGLSAGWWTTWTFSDGFHPTPYAHRLLAASVSRALARSGWL